MTGELFVSRIGSQTWAALCEGGSLVELRVEDDADRDAVGQIVKARVARLLPGIESAFVDVGQDRDAYLHALRADPTRSSRSTSPIGAAPSSSACGSDRTCWYRSIATRFARRGARVTCQIALAGRYLVYLPMSRGCRISRRVHGATERERLDRVIADPGDTPGGWIVRTAAAGLPASRLIADRDGVARTMAGGAHGRRRRCRPPECSTGSPNWRCACCATPTRIGSRPYTWTMRSSTTVHSSSSARSIRSW